MSEETKQVPIHDINHPDRKRLRQGLSSILHAALEEYAESNGGITYVDAAVVLANLTGAVAAQGEVDPEALCGMLKDTCAETKIELADEALAKNGVVVSTQKKPKPRFRD